MLDIDAAIGKKDRAFGVIRKLGKKLVADPNDLMFLSARACNFSRNRNILRIAEHPSERVTAKRPGRSLAPGHDHSRVQAAGERNPYPLRPFKISGKRFREDFP